MKKKNKQEAREYSSEILKRVAERRDPLRSNRVQTKMGLAARIDDILKEIGWKKKDLADKLGKHPSEITRWLSGTHNFTADTLSDIELVTGRKVFFLPSAISKVRIYKFEITTGMVSEPTLSYSTRDKSTGSESEWVTQGSTFFGGSGEVKSSD